MCRIILIVMTVLFQQRNVFIRQPAVPMPLRTAALFWRSIASKHQRGGDGMAWQRRSIISARNNVVCVLVAKRRQTISRRSFALVVKHGTLKLVKARIVTTSHHVISIST